LKNLRKVTEEAREKPNKREIKELKESHRGGQREAKQERGRAILKGRDILRG